MFLRPAAHYTTMATVAVYTHELSAGKAYRPPFARTDAGVAAVTSSKSSSVRWGTRFGEERLLIAPELELTYGAGSGWEFAMEGREI